MKYDKTVYLAGKITGDPNYKEKFLDAQKKLEAGGFIVMNPALLPAEGFSWGAYIRMSEAMLDECKSVCFLPDWTDSVGARIEHARAESAKKHIFYYDEMGMGK